MQELVSQRRFAGRMGVSPPAVGKAIKNGRIFGAAIVGSKLDFAVASAQFKKNCDISKKRKIKTKSKPKSQPQTKKSESKPAKLVNLKDIQGLSGFEDDEDDFEPEQYAAPTKKWKASSEPSEDKIENELNKQKVRSEIAKADKLELQVEVMRGNLIEVEKVTVSVFELLRGLRDHWLIFPDRVSADMAAKLSIDKTDLKNLLTEEVKKHLSQTEDLHFEIK